MSDQAAGRELPDHKPPDRTTLGPLLAVHDAGWRSGHGVRVSHRAWLRSENLSEWGLPNGCFACELPDTIYVAAFRVGHHAGHRDPQGRPPEAPDGPDRPCWDALRRGLIDGHADGLAAASRGGRCWERSDHEPLSGAEIDALHGGCGCRYCASAARGERVGAPHFTAADPRPDDQSHLEGHLRYKAAAAQWRIWLACYPGRLTAHERHSRRHEARAAARRAASAGKWSPLEAAVTADLLGVSVDDVHRWQRLPVVGEAPLPPALRVPHRRDDRVDRWAAGPPPHDADGDCAGH